MMTNKSERKEVDNLVSIKSAYVTPEEKVLDPGRWMRRPLIVFLIQRDGDC